MFYLLENNKIIDSTISYTKNFPFWVEKEGCLFAKSKNDKFVRPYNENKIKKQSENVLDLVEKEDLIKLKFSDSFNILEVAHIGGGVCGMRGIQAIYKPNSKGDYIKVWEAKNVD